MTDASCPAAGDAELAALLAELSTSQTELLSLLAEKRQVLARGDAAGLLALQPREAALLARLEACQQRRGELLQMAGEAGLPTENLRALAASFAPQAQAALAPQFADAAARTRLLQHQSLVNWVIVQRTLLHLSQLLEIFATGGRSEPTYDKGASSSRGGALLDQAV